MGSFLFIIFNHWVADFVLQKGTWATEKAVSFKQLLKHTATYSSYWFLPVLLFTGDILGTILFVITTFITHTLTDYFTSKIVRKKFNENDLGGDLPNFGGFSMIGFDQVLHYFQLIITWYLIFGIN